MNDAVTVAIIGMAGAGIGWVLKTLYGAIQNRPKLRARVFARQGQQDGIPRRLLIIDIINYGRSPVVITDLEVFVERFRILRSGVAMQDLRGEHDLPYTLPPTETLWFQIDMCRFAQELLGQGAFENARIRARFNDVSRAKYFSKRSQMTLGEMAKAR